MSEEKKDNNFDDMLEKAKDFAQDVAAKAGELAAAIGDKTEEVVEIAKKKIEAEKLEYTINKKYRELGKAYYAFIKKGGEPVDELLEELEALHVALDAADIDEDDVEAADEAAECCCASKEEEKTDCGCDKKEEE